MMQVANLAKGHHCKRERGAWYLECEIDEIVLIKQHNETRLVKPGDYTYVPSCKGKRLVYLTVTPKMLSGQRLLPKKIEAH